MGQKLRSGGIIMTAILTWIILGLFWVQTSGQIEIPQISNGQPNPKTRDYYPPTTDDYPTSDAPYNPPEPEGPYKSPHITYTTPPSTSYPTYPHPPSTPDVTYPPPTSTPDVTYPPPTSTPRVTYPSKPTTPDFSTSTPLPTVTVEPTTTEWSTVTVSMPTVPTTMTTPTTTTTLRPPKCNASWTGCWKHSDCCSGHCEKTPLGCTVCIPPRPQ